RTPSCLVRSDPPSAPPPTTRPQQSSDRRPIETVAASHPPARILTHSTHAHSRRRREPLFFAAEKFAMAGIFPHSMCARWALSFVATHRACVFLILGRNGHDACCPARTQ